MQSLRLYLDVAHCRSFSQAAALHGITQSAASQRIRQLEKHLGVTLIDRSVRPLALTEAGKIFLEGCQDIIERHDQLEQKVCGLRRPPAGRVRVAAIYSAGIDLLSQVQEQFEAQHPHITVEIQYGQPDGVYQQVRDNGCDLGIVSYPQRWRHVGIIPLRDEVMAVVCHPEHPLAKQEQVHARQLTDCPMVTFDAHLPVGRQLRKYLKVHGATPKITNVFDNLDTIKSVVAVTDQVSILPKRTVIREVASKTLALIELEPHLVRPMGVIFRNQRRNGASVQPLAQAFVDFLLEHSGPNVDPLDTIHRHGGALVGGLA